MYQTLLSTGYAIFGLLLISTGAAETPGKPFPFETVLESKALAGTQEIELDLGEQLCNETIEIEWKILNPLESAIDWPRSTSSCGCITNVPPKLSIQPAKTPKSPSATTVKFKIKLPTTPEQLGRQVVFWDAGGTAHLHATVKCRVQAHIRLENNIIPVSNDLKTTYSIPLTATTDKLDLQTMQFQTFGAEVINTSFQATDRGSGVLQLELDPKNVDQDATQSSLQLEIQHESTTLSRLPLTIHYKHRTAVVPKIPTFQVQNKEYRCQFILRSAGLVEALLDKHEIQAYAIERTGKKETKVPLSIEPQKNQPENTLCKLNISLQSTTLPKGFSPQTLLIQCGKWEHEIQCHFPK